MMSGMLTEFAMYLAQLMISLAVAMPTSGIPSWESLTPAPLMKTALNPTFSTILADKQSYAPGAITTPGSFSNLRNIDVFFNLSPFHCYFLFLLQSRQCYFGSKFY
jgi:hypothetical protein